MLRSVVHQARQPKLQAVIKKQHKWTNTSSAVVPVSAHVKSVCRKVSMAAGDSFSLSPPAGWQGPQVRHWQVAVLGTRELQHQAT